MTRLIDIPSSLHPVWKRTANITLVQYNNMHFVMVSLSTLVQMYGTLINLLWPSCKVYYVEYLIQMQIHVSLVPRLPDLFQHCMRNVEKIGPRESPWPWGQG